MSGLRIFFKFDKGYVNLKHTKYNTLVGRKYKNHRNSKVYKSVELQHGEAVILYGTTDIFEWGKTSSSAEFEESRRKRVWVYMFNIRGC